MLAAVGLFAGSLSILVSTTFKDPIHSKIAIGLGGVAVGFGAALQCALKIEEKL
ncbi:MAG: hypothetical protein RBJ76_03260 [Stenomitos frigidus ULC029]